MNEVTTPPIPSKQFIETFFRYVNGTASQKTLFLCVMVAPSILFGLGVLHYGIEYMPVGIEAFSLDVAKIARIITVLFALIFSVCGLMAYKGNFSNKVLHWVLVVTVISTSIVTNIAIYFAGSVSSSVVLLLASAGVLITMVLPKKESRQHVLFLLLLYIAPILLTLADWIPYAPMVVEAPDYHRGVSVFWSISNGLFGLTSLVVVFLAAEFVLEQARIGQNELLFLSRTDPLTGLFNRRFLMERFDVEVGRAIRTGQPLACMLMDIDNFKRINDVHGHLVGDSVLKAVATVLNAEKREYDIIARFGGDEFVLVLPETNRSSSASIAKRLKVTMSQCSSLSTDFTLSIGIALLDVGTSIDTSDKLLLAADQALYAAKQAGRNRYEFSS